MNALFKTIHSVLDPAAVAEVCAEQYGFGEVPQCQFIHRGMNDVYRLRAGSTQYALRAWRASWRSMDDVVYELEFLDFLKHRKLPVAAGIRCQSGARYFVVNAPEGPRALAAFEWVPGVKFAERIDVDLAARLGAVLADIHLAGVDFRPSIARRTNPAGLITDNMPYLEQLLSDTPADLDFYSELAPRLVDALQQIDPQVVPMGTCHGDFHLNNGIIDDQNHITFLDFDNSGQDYLAQDVMAYYWANEFTGHQKRYADRFVEGYETRRPFSNAERGYFPLFILAKEFRLLTGYAKHSQSLGHYLTKFKNLDWFARSIRRHAREAGLA
jgi:Ser/Thr protein kinase RdoA (MazF antagonist)